MRDNDVMERYNFEQSFLGWDLTKLVFTSFLNLKLQLKNKVKTFISQS
jgi:hypothetical protein